MMWNEQWRNGIGFWIFGATLNFGYNLMLAAAHDLLKPQDRESQDQLCNPLSTGTFLLADTIGGVIGIAVAPVSPMTTHAKIVVVTIMSIASFVITAYANSETMALLGVLVAAFSAGAGEATILNASLRHEAHVISAYTSGLGAAAILSSLAYLWSMMFFSTRTALLIMVIIPLIMYSTFALVIQNPGDVIDCKEIEFPETALKIGGPDEKSFRAKGIALMRLAPATLIPIFMTSVLRSFITQGLLELVHSHDVAISADVQYRYFHTLVNLGMFVSQSSRSLCSVRRLWILPVIETVVLFAILVQILLSSPNFYIIASLSFCTGLAGGAVIVNTYFRVRQETSHDLQSIHMEGAIFSNELGAAAAGFIAIPSHSFICQTISAFKARL